MKKKVKIFHDFNHENKKIMFVKLKKKKIFALEGLKITKFRVIKLYNFKTFCIQIKKDSLSDMPMRKAKLDNITFHVNFKSIIFILQNVSFL